MPLYSQALAITAIWHRAGLVENIDIDVSDLSPNLVKQFKGAGEELKLPPIPFALIDKDDAFEVNFNERVSLAQNWLDTKLAGLWPMRRPHDDPTIF